MLRRATLVRIQFKRFTTQWYYATDIPNAKPHEPEYKPSSLPKIFEKLTEKDSKKLETKYIASLNEKKDSTTNTQTFVEVGEDDLLTVDINDLTMKPTYWEGPTYEVRRGIWFNSNGSPLSSQLCAELETLSKTKNDVQKLTGTYEEGKYALFIDDEMNAGFILKSLDGGKLFLNYLKSGLGSYLPINGIAVYKGKRKPVKDGKVDNYLIEPISKEAESVKTQVENDKNTSVDFNSYIANLTNWDIFNNMPSLFGSTSEGNTLKPSQIHNDVRQQLHNDGRKLNDKRKINDLVLCVHGIGQTLGKKYEYVNFAHTVNLLRTNIKKLYSESDQLKALNKSNESLDWKTNSGVQVLPITWRHSIDFKTDSIEEEIESPELPSLSDITIPGILPLRKLMGDVALDVLLYNETYYMKIILGTVVKELNDTYTLFKKKNPDFNGRVHLIGHSLGSLILLDLLSQHRHYKLKFEVENFFSIGSPIGLMKLVERTKIGPKKGFKSKSLLRVNRPNCRELYNIYHTCDPVAYRIEPLIDVEMAKYEHSYLPHWSELDGFTTKMIEMSGNIWDGLPSTTNNKLGDEQLEAAEDKTKLNEKNKEKIKEKIKEKKKEKTTIKLTGELKDLLTSLNHTGRIDYSLRPNFLDVDLISTIKSHVSYFEEPDIAGFILREILNPPEKVTEIIVNKI